MRRWSPCERVIAGACLAAVCGSGLRGQELEVALIDGSTATGELVAMAGAGHEANIRLRGATTTTIPLARVLAIHGVGPTPPSDAVVFLVGGDQLRGELRGGDEVGETLSLWSRSLGELQIPIDRLEAVVFPGAGEAPDLRQFRLPEDAPFDEALFRKARRGFDTIMGAIHRFSPRGVLFEWSETAEPELFAYQSLSAIRLRSGVPPDGAGRAQLLTRAGDVVSVELVGMRDGDLLFQLEGDRVVPVELASVSAVTFGSADRLFLSDLEPVRVEERGTPFEEADTPLYSYRRDRAAAGGFLVVDGKTHGKGLGTHSRCVLTYRVPEGFEKFHARVGIDDGVLETGVRGHAEISVQHSGRVIWGPRVVRSVEPAQNLGVLSVEPGQLLTLVVDFGDAWFLGDRVNWLSPVFLR